MFRFGDGGYRCRVKIQDRRERRREKARAEGRCMQCMHEPAITGTLCFDCAGKRDMWNLTRS